MFFNIQQNSDEWYKLRHGMVTSSKLSSIMANTIQKNGFNPKYAFGQPAIKYAHRLIEERLSGQGRDEENYTNEHMENGHIYEPIARELYEAKYFIDVTNGGFYSFEELGYKYFGDSPDGVVGEKGRIEIKSVVNDTQWERIKTGKFDTTYKWQIQGHLFDPKTEWCDFISYCHDFPFENKRLFVQRIYRDENMQNQIRERLNEFEKLIKTTSKLLNIEW